MYGGGDPCSGSSGCGGNIDGTRAKSISAGIAQQEEQVFCKYWVAGSSPEVGCDALMTEKGRREEKLIRQVRKELAGRRYCWKSGVPFQQTFPWADKIPASGVSHVCAAVSFRIFPSG